MDELEVGLVLLQSELSKVRRQCIETLLKIHRNILENPDNPKFRKLRQSNERVSREIWQLEGGRTIMLAVGWLVDGDFIQLPEGSLSAVKNLVSLLVDNRLVQPDESEWVEETKHIIANPQKQREEELRAKALIQKEKEMAELKKSMEEKKQIAARIKAEHAADRQRRAAEAPARAQQLNLGATGKGNMSDLKPPGGG